MPWMQESCIPSTLNDSSMANSGAKNREPLMRVALPFFSARNHRPNERVEAIIASYRNHLHYAALTVEGYCSPARLAARGTNSEPMNICQKLNDKLPSDSWLRLLIRVAAAQHRAKAIGETREQAGVIGQQFFRTDRQGDPKRVGEQQDGRGRGG